MTTILNFILFLISSWYFLKARTNWQKSILTFLGLGFLLIATGQLINHVWISGAGYFLYSISTLLFLIVQLARFEYSGSRIALLCGTLILIVIISFKILHLPGGSIIKFIAIPLAIFFLFVAVRQPPKIESFISISTVFAASLLIDSIYILAEISAQHGVYDMSVLFET